MDDFTREHLEGLLSAKNGNRASIYMPIHSLKTEAGQDQILFRNLLRDTGSRLNETGMRQTNVARMLAPAETLLSDAPFWRREGKGLAVFIGEDDTRTYRLKEPFAPFVYVGSRYYVKPLIPLITRDGRYYLLALSAGNVRLMEGGRSSIREISLSGIPQSLAEALRFHELKKQLQFHTAGPVGRLSSSGKPMGFHGHGASANDEKERIREYFRSIDTGIRDFLGRGKTPMVLAGVDYMCTIYREINSYPHLVETGIHGNPDDSSAQELGEKAWDIVELRFAENEQQAVKRYHTLAGTGLTSSDLHEILTAARFGRIDTLIVSRTGQCWGRFDFTSGDLDLHETPGPGDDELLDSAVVDTLAKSGEVFAVSDEVAPEPYGIGALMRY